MTRFILTGAPGGGKSAILARIATLSAASALPPMPIVGSAPAPADGGGRTNLIHTVAEPAREILAEQRATGGRGTPEQDPELFVQLLLARSIGKFDGATAWSGPVLYDRGIPDCVGYAVHLGADPTRSREAARLHRYHPQVLVLEPWETIYATDAERKMSYEASLQFHEALMDGYREAGYGLIPVPRDTVEGRVAFIRDFIAHATLG